MFTIFSSPVSIRLSCGTSATPPAAEEKPLSLHQDNNEIMNALKKIISKINHTDENIYDLTNKFRSL